MTQLRYSDGTIDRKRNWNEVHPSDIDNALTEEERQIYCNSEWKIWERHTIDDNDEEIKVYAVTETMHYIEDPDESFEEAIKTIKGICAEVDAQTEEECDNEEYAECQICNKFYKDGTEHMRQAEHGEIICNECYEKYYCECENCGKIIEKDSAQYSEYYGKWYHPICLVEKYCDDVISIPRLKKYIAELNEDAERKWDNEKIIKMDEPIAKDGKLKIGFELGKFDKAFFDIILNGNGEYEIIQPDNQPRHTQEIFEDFLNYAFKDSLK